MSQMILFDSDFKEIGPVNVDLDAEYGTSSDSTNDFEIVTDVLSKYSPYGGYIPNTEVGGVFEYIQSESGEQMRTIKGYTWRGLLSMSIILPPAGSDYNVVSGEANTIISSIVSDVLGGFFSVSSEDSGLIIDSYRFPLYVNTLDGLEGMLEEYGYRLKITAVKENGKIAVYLSAEQATTIEGVYNEDSRVPMVFTINQMGINHLICGGSGTLQDRMRIDLYIDGDGNVSQTQTFTGFDERTEFYDYANAESEDDLISNGKKRLLELASSRTLEIDSPEDLDLEIGDLVRGVFQDGTAVTSPVVRKVYKISNGLTTTEIKIKGEN